MPCRAFLFKKRNRLMLKDNRHSYINNLSTLITYHSMSAESLTLYRQQSTTSKIQLLYR